MYVCDDVVATSPQLSQIATYEGRIVGSNIVDGPTHMPDSGSIPTVSSRSLPPKRRGLEFRVEANDMRNWLSGPTYAETAA